MSNLSILQTASVTLFAFILAACSSGGKHTNDSYVPSYFAAMNAHPILKIENMHSGEATKASFQALFENIGDSQALSDSVRQLYSETLFFNDTFHTFTNSETLFEYFDGLAEKVTTVEVDVTDVSTSNNDVYLRWEMTIGFKDLNDGKPTTSIGMSHLRFDTNGKVVIHQDYWDSTDGFYRHIPIVSSLIRAIKKRL